MGALFVYILKSAICLAMFYLFYRALLSKETFHRFNRIALLSMLVISFVVPSIQWNYLSHNQAGHAMAVIEDLFMSAVPNDDVAATSLSWQRGLVVIYLLGVIFFLLRQLVSLASMYHLIRNGKKEKLEEGICLVTHQKPIGPFSWMHYMVLSEIDLAENPEAILLHERAHIRNKHSFDIMWVDFCIAVQWFNPAAWLVKRELQDVHEYEADASVLHQGVDAKKYQLLLIKKAVGTRLYSMANSFNHSSLKKRITMMVKKKSNPWARMKYLYVLPMAAIAVAAFARPEVSSELKEISKVKVSDFVAEMKVASEKNLSDTAKTIVPQEPVKGDAFSVVENPPQFPGGMKELMTFLGKNIQYPVEAKDKKIEGRVIVQFVVKKDGSTSDFNVLRAVHPLLDAEALRVLKTMPKWTPGTQRGEAVNVKFVVPVRFALQKSNGMKAGNKIDNDAVSDGVRLQADSAALRDKALQGHSRSVVISQGSKENSMIVGGNPLVILDGKETTMNDPEVKNLPTERIESVTVLKDPSRLAAYGAKAKDGVMIITTKKK